MNNYPEQYASPHGRRPCVRVPLYHDNQKIYLEVQYCPETLAINVVKLHPQMKDGTVHYSMLVEVGYDITAQLQSYGDIAEGLQQMSKRSLRKSDGTPITIRGAVLDKLINDPNLEA